MLFELSIAKKYLLPKKRHLSVSFISLMSIGIISLVVWLVLIFLSVTDGIEKNWLKKLTALNSPIQIHPKEAYYDSYYYQADEISTLSNYQKKSLLEKKIALVSDPHTEGEDPEIPLYFPEKVLNQDGSLKDFVKLAFSSIDQITIDKQKLIAQDYETAGAMVKLSMVRPHKTHEISHRDLSYVSYISSFNEKNPHLSGLIAPPSEDDLNHLFFLTETADFQAQIELLLTFTNIQQLTPSSHQWRGLFSLLPEGKEFEVIAHKNKNKISHLSLPLKKEGNSKGEKLRKENNKLIFTPANGKTVELKATTRLVLEESLIIDVERISKPFNHIYSLKDLTFNACCKLQGYTLQGETSFQGLKIHKAAPQVIFNAPPPSSPPWAYQIQKNNMPPYFVLPEKKGGKVAAIFPKSFQNNDVKIGDQGHLTYGSMGSGSSQEQHLPIYVAGFYDSGVMAIGSKVILTDRKVVHDISMNTPSLDGNGINGIQVWFDNLDMTSQAKDKLQKAFEIAGIAPYFSITPFYEYEFAKDLLEQFQSDKHLFTLVGIIILIVACSNIISLLTILVNDKKKEIAILTAMGASKKKIALIFTLCGGLTGLISTFIGTVMAIFTLHYIDQVVSFLSFLQGHAAFNTAFYGNSLPNKLSPYALNFILITTPIFSLLAGVIPALKACRLHPSQELRS